MYGCEILFNKEQGERMIELVERTTGQPCPCKQGLTCPLLGERSAVDARAVGVVALGA